jgi:hypothetical protein
MRLGYVAVDGTKIKANASKHKAMSYGRMAEAETRLKDEVAAWLEQAATIDAAEDAEHGTEQRGDELPARVASKQERLAKIRQARSALESEARRQRRARRCRRVRMIPARLDHRPQRTCPQPSRPSRHPRRSATSPIRRAGS